VIDRRAFLGTAALAVLAAPNLGEARSGAAHRVPRGGVLGESNPIGWTVTTSVADIACRWAGDRPDRLPDLASQLLALDVDVLVALGAASGRAASQRTARVPIVVVADGGVAEEAVVAALARSVRNVTWLGVLSETGMVEPRVRLLSSVVPRLSRIAALFNPETDTNTRALAGLAGRSLDHAGELVPFPARTLEEVQGAVHAMRQGAFEGLVVLADALFVMHAARLVELATDARLPAVYGARAFVEAGGLLALHGDTAESIRRTATVVGRILAGEAPAAVSPPPCQRPRLAFSAAAARRLGLALRPALLAGADA
jgi:putative ABC transport system substrate-binding protein